MTLAPDAFEERLAEYLFERSEEGRAVRVGEKETSEQAAIVARYADLFTRAQRDALREAEDVAEIGLPQERLHRLRTTCEGGIVAAELAEREDALENALLAARVEWDGEELPLRTAQARLAVLPDYGDRDRLGAAQLEVSAGFNDERLSLLGAQEALDADLSGDPDPIARHEREKGIGLHALHLAVFKASLETESHYGEQRGRWFERLLGPEREEIPSSAHAAWIRRLSPLESTYTAEQAVPVCTATLHELGFDLDEIPGIRLDLEDRPQKSPRACVIASDPPRLVHLITRAQGGIHDYESFLHEAGHALHYASISPELPYAFRRLSRDHALTEIYSFLVESVSRVPEWHRRHFGLRPHEAKANAEGTAFVEALLFRRYTAKLGFELGFWERFEDDGGSDDGYADLLTEATGLRYRSEGHLADMDAGFYSADYLRAWIRAAQFRAWLREEVGRYWWRSSETGDVLRMFFRHGTVPASEEIAIRLGFSPYDTGPLVAELTGYA